MANTFFLKDRIINMFNPNSVTFALFTHNSGDKAVSDKSASYLGGLTECLKIFLVSICWHIYHIKLCVKTLLVSHFSGIYLFAFHHYHNASISTSVLQHECSLWQKTEPGTRCWQLCQREFSTGYLEKVLMVSSVCYNYSFFLDLQEDDLSNQWKKQSSS